MKSLVLNKGFGGPGWYSDEFRDWIRKYKKEWIIADEEGGEEHFNYDIETYDWVAFRSDPVVVDYVLNGPSNGRSNLRVIEVPGYVNSNDWYIHDYDGIETARKKDEETY